jgi:hypothetical protein
MPFIPIRLHVCTHLACPAFTGYTAVKISSTFRSTAQNGYQSYKLKNLVWLSQVKLLV